MTTLVDRATSSPDVPLTSVDEVALRAVHLKTCPQRAARPDRTLWDILAETPSPNIQQIKDGQSLFFGELDFSLEKTHSRQKGLDV